MLVLGAHPDDGLLGAGGIAAHLTARGGRVVFLTATLGELGGDPLTRKAEDIAAAQILGVELHSGKLPDGRIARRPAITLIEDAIQLFDPTTVLAHYPHDSHQDHACLGRAAIAACSQVPNLLFYEGPTSQRFWPSLVTDISEVWDRKREAILAHRSQISRTDLVGWSDSTSRFRAWPRYGRSRCEGYRLHHSDFWALSAVVADRESGDGNKVAFTDLTGRP